MSIGKRCVGCGRLLGNRTEVECPCWLSHSDRAIVPARLLEATRRIKRLRESGR